VQIDYYEMKQTVSTSQSVTSTSLLSRPSLWHFQAARKTSVYQLPIPMY